MAAEPDLLDLARAAPDRMKARWAFVEHPTIASILGREVRRLTHTEDDRADLASESRLAIVEALSTPRAYTSEARLVCYWNLRIRGLVEAALRRSGGCVLRDGRVVQVESPAGDDVLGDRVEEPAHPRLLTEVAGATLHEGTEHTLASHRRQQHEAERRRLLELARDYLFQYGSEEAARCVWYRVQGAPWKEVPGLAGLPTGPAGRERAAVLFHKFVADARRHFIERGERVSVTILGLHVDEMTVSAVLLSGREIVDTWTAEADGPEDLVSIEKRLRRALGRGVNVVAATPLPGCETEALVRTLCARREIELDELDVDRLDRLRRGFPGDALERTGLEPGLREAYVAARAKAIECELRMECHV